METQLFECFLFLQGTLTIVLLLELSRRDVADRPEETAKVEPVQPFQGYPAPLILEATLSMRSAEC